MGGFSSPFRFLSCFLRYVDKKDVIGLLFQGLAIAALFLAVKLRPYYGFHVRDKLELGSGNKLTSCSISSTEVFPPTQA